MTVPRAYVVAGGRVLCARHLTAVERTGAVAILPSERWDEYPECDRCGDG